MNTPPAVSPTVFSAADIEAAVAQGVLTPEHAAGFTAFLQARPTASAPADHKPRFDLTHLLWYAGALLVMGAMGLFSTLAFAQMGGAGLTVTGIGYFLALGIAGDRLWRKPETRTPGGLLIAAAIAMVPMIVFGVQEATGSWAGFARPGDYRSFFQYIKGGWIPMELATLVVSVLAARRYSFAFIAFPGAVTLWFLSMDIADYLRGGEYFNFEFRRQVSLWFGLGTFLVVWIYELRLRKADFAFWLHMVAAVTFWGGLTLQSSSSEMGKFLYCLVNVALLAVSLFMGRRVYAVFGVIGIMTYLGHLASKVFKDSILFPFALSLFGLMMVAAGLWIARHRHILEAKMQAVIPPQLAALRPVGAQEKS